MDVPAFLSDGQRDQDARELMPVMDSVKQKYPALSKHEFRVRRGEGQGYLEFYPPWERDNPSPGFPTLEIRDKSIKGQDLEDMIAADALHHLGSVDPDGKPVDESWLKMKSALAKSLTPKQLAIDRRAHLMDTARGERRSFEDFMQVSRLDGYIRAGLFPRINPDWQRPGTFTPDQDRLFEMMKYHLSKE